MQTERNIATAQTEYYRRPADERYENLAALVKFSQHERELTKERSYNWRDLTWQPTAEGSQNAGAGLVIRSPQGAATLTHWSFGQAARMLQAPAAFLRDGLSPDIAAQALNYRISQQPHGSAPVLLARAANGAPLPTVRAVTSESYARVWDADLYGTLEQRFGSKWTNPPTWDGKPAGIYRSDRDSFALLCEGGSIVNDPSLQQGNGSGEMYRGLMIRNSEVGACSVSIEAVLYRFVCGNHMLWGAVIDKTFRRRHVGQNVLRDTMRSINDLAYKWTNRAASQDEQIIRGLIDHEIASSKDAIVDELQAAGWTRQQAIDAYDSCEGNEKASPRSYWGMAQGATRVSQATPFQDERYELDKLAAALLAKGRKLIAA